MDKNRPSCRHELCLELSSRESALYYQVLLGCRRISNWLSEPGAFDN